MKRSWVRLVFLAVAVVPGAGAARGETVVLQQGRAGYGGCTAATLWEPKNARPTSDEEEAVGIFVSMLLAGDVLAFATGSATPALLAGHIGFDPANHEARTAAFDGLRFMLSGSERRLGLDAWLDARRIHARLASAAGCRLHRMAA